MKNRLAIILPAYKPDFLKETLRSIANQHDNRFKLYIGDDNSPFDLKSIVYEFEGSIDLIYHRFEDNLGSQNLVGHWKRCVELVESEEWIWLFADDDTMDPQCVQSFYKYIEEDPNGDVLHFNVLVIDQNGNLLKSPPRFPEKLDAGDFFYRRINYQLSSFAIEYIVRRSVYDQMGGFVNFDLAWCSDDASWISFSHLKSIKTLTGAKVQWRSSGLNITTLDQDKGILYRKTMAQVAFMNWAVRFFREKGITDRTTAYRKIRWILDLSFHSRILTLKDKVEITKTVLGAVKLNVAVIWVWFYLGYCEIKCLLKKWMRLGSN